MKLTFDGPMEEGLAGTSGIGKFVQKQQLQHLNFNNNNPSAYMNNKFLYPSSSLLPSASTAANAFGTQEICTFEQWTQLPNQPGALRIFALISLLTTLIILVVGGNALVIAAVIMRRRLRTATGLLILSLAVADLLVGFVILPFSLANEVLNGFWIFGDIWCTAWLTTDIWMCTSSVYNLVAISVDRYIAIIKPLNYHTLITKFRARVIIAVVWISSFIVCSPSFLLASSKRNSYIAEQMARNGTTSAQQFVLQNPDACRCTPSNSGMYYILFSASSSFYIPYIVVIFVYARIYLAAMAATKSQYAGMVQVAENANKKPVEKTKNDLDSKSNMSSTLKLPKLFSSKAAQLRERHQFEMHRMSMDPPRSVPICLNSSSMPTVYAQINGSCGNLQCLRNTGSSEFERRRSDERLLPKDGKEERICSPVRLSVPSEVVYELPNVAEKSQQKRHQKNKIGNGPSANGGDCAAAGTTEDNNTSADESNEGSTAEEEMSKSMLLSAVDNDNNPTDKLANNHNNADPPTTAENTTLLNPHNNAATSSPQNSNKSVSGSSSRGDKNFVMALLTRILGKAKRKKAGGTYEKRLSVEIKAAKTVAIVTGCFIFCWLGFSIYYGLTAFGVHVHEVIWSVFFWFGYLNSAFNPVIYTVFNREFRTCFKQLLTCNNMIFASRANTQMPMCNSFNSQLRFAGNNDPMIRRKHQTMAETSDEA